MSELLKKLRNAIVEGDEEQALQATRDALDSGTDPVAIVSDGLAAAMNDIGRLWNEEEIFLPEVVFSAQIFKECMNLVEPALLGGKSTEPAAHFVLGTVKGDLHDLGKNMVGTMLQTAGFRVHDLGKDVPAERFVEKVKELGSALVGLSALLTTTMLEQKRVIEALERAGLRDKVRVLVGGAPVTDSWAREVGADGYAPNAPQATEVAKKLLSELKEGGNA